MQYRFNSDSGDTMILFTHRHVITETRFAARAVGDALPGPLRRVSVSRSLARRPIRRR